MQIYLTTLIRQTNIRHHSLKRRTTETVCIEEKHTVATKLYVHLHTTAAISAPFTLTCFVTESRADLLYCSKIRCRCASVGWHVQIKIEHCTKIMKIMNDYPYTQLRECECLCVPVCVCAFYSMCIFDLLISIRTDIVHANGVICPSLLCNIIEFTNVGIFTLSIFHCSFFHFRYTFSLHLIFVLLLQLSFIHSCSIPLICCSAASW